MLVKEIMTHAPVTIAVKAPVRDAAGLLKKHHIGGLPVMDGEKIVGIVTESDIIALLETGRISDDLWLPSPLEIIEVPVREFINWENTKAALADIGDTPVEKVMTHPVITITEDADIEEAASILLREGIARLPVVRGTALVGIVTRADIVQGVGSGFDTSEENAR
ncbi:MAG TPA: CBS domain-containing protein [Methanoregulaceae archaeon]|nr:CBS domain-containing protein [Methanoregulaceae archaeon]